MPKGIGFGQAAKMMSRGRKKKKDKESLAGRHKRDIEEREDKTDEALRKAGVSEEEIRRLGGGRKKKDKKKGKK